MRVLIGALAACVQAALASGHPGERLLDRYAGGVLEGDAGRLIALGEIQDDALRLEHERWALRVAADPPDVFDLRMVARFDELLTVDVRAAWGDRMFEFRRSAYVVPAEGMLSRVRWGGWLVPWAEPDRSPEALRVLSVGRLSGVGEELSARWDEARDAAMWAVGAPPPGMMTATLYDSPESLAFSIPAPHADVSLLRGWHEKGETIRLALTEAGAGAEAEAGVEALLPVLAHEAAHAAQFALGPAGDRLPRWLTEGLGELAADRIDPRADRAHELCAAWLRAGTLASWPELEVDPLLPGAPVSRVYAQGLSLVAFVERAHGREALHAWVASMARGEGLDGACRGVLGGTFDDLDGAWRGWLAARD